MDGVFRALRAQWLYASRRGQGLGGLRGPPPRPLDLAVATQEATDNDSTSLRKTRSREIAVAIRSGAVLIRNTASP